MNTFTIIVGIFLGCKIIIPKVWTNFLKYIVRKSEQQQRKNFHK